MLGRRSNGPAARRTAPRARVTGWTLPLTGRPEGLFVLKNAMQTLRASDAGLLRQSMSDLLRDVARDERSGGVAKSRACLALARSSKEKPDDFWAGVPAEVSELRFRENLLAARYLARRGHPQAWDEVKTAGLKREPELVAYLESNLTTD